MKKYSRRNRSGRIIGRIVGRKHVVLLLSYEFQGVNRTRTNKPELSGSQRDRAKLGVRVIG